MPITAVSSTHLADTARRLAALAAPASQQAGREWAAQSLGSGTAGIALLHVERALTGAGTWAQAHAWIAAAAEGEISACDTAGLYQGLPAVTFLLDAASCGGRRYRDGLAAAGRHLEALAHARADTIAARIASGRPAAFREYDVFFGLAGVGALLLRRAPASSAMQRVLDALVSLTRPLRLDGETVPGWWTGHDPSRRHSAGFPGGHANFGAAHGIAGPLALLGHAMRCGVTVDGQAEAVGVIFAWLDAWRQDTGTGPWWPEWITMTDLMAGRPGQRAPNRPSWCYGTPGIARAGQVAAIAVGDRKRRAVYEEALARCLADPAQSGLISDAGLCHGAAGLYMTARRAAADAPAIAAELPRLAEFLLQHAERAVCQAPGLLEGRAGTALALYAAAAETAPISGWDACLLIS